MSFVAFTHMAREWDARFNVPTDDDLSNLLGAVRTEWDQGKYKYLFVSGTEIGTLQYSNDYKIRHVHLCIVLNNRTTKSAILKNFGVKTGNGYYLVPRNQDLPYSGWRTHHAKAETKVDPASTVLFEQGELPADKEAVVVTKRSEEEKKRKVDDIIIEMRGMIERGEDEEAFKKFPRNYLTYGEKLKSIIHQKRDFFKTNGDPHVWLMGTPGTGKSAILQVIYPDYYNKALDSRFFDRFSDDQHTHVLMQDVDHNVVEKLGVQFFKSVCDEAGYPIDQKYKTPQIVRLTILVTSNFTIDDVLPEDLKGRRENLAALKRRFWSVNVKDLLPILGIKLLPKYEIQQLKKAGNKDPKKLFMSWDYLRDAPTGEPLKEAKDYQELIRQAYYK